MKTTIIAEAGVNHNGSIDLAKQLIDVAKKAGADYVKFQTFTAKSLVTKFADKAQYQKTSTHKSESQFEMLKKLELNYDSHIELIKYCDEIGIEFLSTAFDLDSIDMLNQLNIALFKIPSGEINNIPYLRYIGSLGRPIIMSTGMSTIKEIQLALKTLSESGANKRDITILHCNTEYPTPLHDVNLNAMITIRDELNVPVGYSDHTIGFDTSIAAVALGAKVIEKHFTLDTDMEGPDHKASLNPNKLYQMIKSIRNVEILLGSNIKQPTASEKKNISIARKSIVAKVNIKKGDIFNNNNLTTKRPGTGISPIYWDEFIGKKSKKDYTTDELIER